MPADPTGPYGQFAPAHLSNSESPDGVAAHVRDCEQCNEQAILHQLLSAQLTSGHKPETTFPSLEAVVRAANGGRVAADRGRTALLAYLTVAGLGCLLVVTRALGDLPHRSLWVVGGLIIAFLPVALGATLALLDDRGS